jgi:hypothetical protein
VIREFKEVRIYHDMSSMRKYPVIVSQIANGPELRARSDVPEQLFVAPKGFEQRHYL